MIFVLKRGGLVLLVVSLVYTISVLYRSYTLYNVYQYTPQEDYELASHVFPVRHNRFMDFTEGDQRLSKELLVQVDYSALKNLSKVKGVQLSPIYKGFLLIHQISRLEKDEAEVCDSFRCKVVVKNLDFLVENQTEDGSWLMTFDNHISKRINKAPWRSGLAQALPISALIQGYYLTGNQAYLDTARAALHPMYTSIKDGGVMSVNEYGNVIEEYPFEQRNIHVLNGYLYAVISLLQMSPLDPKAKELLDYHLQLLDKIVEKFKLPGWSAYSLDEPTFRNHANYANPMYHKLHGAQLSVLCDFSGREKICNTADYFVETRRGIVAFTVTVAYIVFKDLVGTLKWLRS